MSPFDFAPWAHNMLLRIPPPYFAVHAELLNVVTAASWRYLGVPPPDERVPQPVIQHCWPSAIGSLGRHTVPMHEFVPTGASAVSSMREKSLSIVPELYDGWSTIFETDISTSFDPVSCLSKSPNTTFKELGVFPAVQCAAVITHLGWMREAPQNEKPLGVRKAACHFHSHSVAC